MGDYEKALSFLQKALDIHENVRCNPLDRATTYINLGETYLATKDYTTAVGWLQKGLEIREKKLPKTHPDLAGVYHNMAKLYWVTKQYGVAMINAQKALEIAEKTLDRNHPHTGDYRKTFEKISKENVH